jgi:hypothetical protein
MKKKIEVYDPAMCCPTGVCGTSVDPKLVQFAADLAWLKEQGVEVVRFNLAQQPLAFAQNPCVSEALKAQGNDCLPLILVNGLVATRSIYPTREQLASLTGLATESCCGEEEGCCGSDKKEENCCGDGNSSCC